MYSTCLFCNQSLGANEAVAAFPVGRRLAFDQRRGRLWVVCRKCEKWNLTPLEERWEAIETCERLFRDTRKRVSTDNIGLARLSEGLELVRIGEPQRPEFAAWRYGDQFGRRRRRSTIIGTSLGILAAGGMFANIAVSGIGGLALSSFQLIQVARDVYRGRRVLLRYPRETGGFFVLRGKDAVNTRLLPGQSTHEWALQLRRGIDGVKEQLVLTGDDARRAAARVMPHFNADGSTRAQTEAAVRHLEEAGDAQRFLAWAARNTRWKNSGEIWIGVEMAVNEENERRALEDELDLLEEAWREAEEIASISDGLLVAAELDAKLMELKQKELTAQNTTDRKGF